MVLVDISKLLGTIVTLANETAKEGEADVLLLVQPQPRSSQVQKGKQDPYVVVGHAMRLGQVFHNLIDNARSFTAKGTSVSIRLRCVQDEIEIRVEDKGPGIQPENLERVFERFYTDRPSDSFGKNSGLGLAISRQIVEAHKGRIRAENRTVKDTTAEGGSVVHGARFIIRLPAVDADQE
jgi:two-component system, OmpR family, sensor histidine kinase ChvG